ncbi:MULTISPECIES: hypothetical protein [Deinococcus]|uniref:N-acetylmuramoyl-L-alanine amidase n=1 Tax=Deinococcus metallilatus TaxID=1211322 RepID=A0ABR6MPQ8_9DEIO|nr:MULTISPECIES: hypothetical protein [Deinococcus]MBB5293902.1 N-acetylmuramoyl-L-alanine amidase [Deinococcus metallilatus]
MNRGRSRSVRRGRRVPAALMEVGDATHPVDGLNLRESNPLDRLALGLAWGSGSPS